MIKKAVLQFPSICSLSLLSLGAAVLLHGISGRCERVRAGGLSPSFWGCQGLDKSCLNFTLCKMPCVNSCPWPKHSDLVCQTPGVSFPMRPWMTVGKGTGLPAKLPKIFMNWTSKLPFSTRNQQWKQSEGVFRWFDDRQFFLLQSSAMSRAVGTSCGKSQTGVMSVASGWSHLCLHYLCCTICHAEKSSTSLWVLWQIILNTAMV